MGAWVVLLPRNGIKIQPPLEEGWGVEKLALQGILLTQRLKPLYRSIP